MKLIRAILSCSCGGAVILGIAAASFAANPPKKHEALAGPFYNAETKSYFQLFRHPSGTIRGYNWATANDRALRKHYKGERGRLAIIKDPKTLEFVREKFSISGATWIGGRYFCKYSKLLWADGKLQTPRVSGMWHAQWHRTDVRCANAGYMPIYLTSPDRGGVFWQASGPKKAFYYYLVEYPTPKKSQDVSQSSKEEMSIPAGASTTE